MKNYLEHQAKWRERKLDTNSDYFKELSSGQSPETFFITCSDSRISLSEMFGITPGEFFVYRNVANQILTNDTSILSALQFAVEALKITKIVICGHSACGGVRAAMKQNVDKHLHDWLEPLSSDLKEQGLCSNEKMAIRRNILLQKENLLKIDFIKKAVDEGLAIHTWVFDLQSGIVEMID
ncbi:MAG: carbonic anhydrase [Bdellovibrionota bacterium]|nr:carbonic anhydrase [Bdellovibrionota bacterium]